MKKDIQALKLMVIVCVIALMFLWIAKAVSNDTLMICFTVIVSVAPVT